MIDVTLLAPYEDEDGVERWVPFGFEATPSEMRRKPDRLSYSDAFDVMRLLAASVLGVSCDA